MHSTVCDCCELWVHQIRYSGVNIPQFELLSYDSKPWFCPKCINTSLPFSLEGSVGEPEEVPHHLNDDLKLLISDLITSSFLHKVSLENKELILLGNFNVNLLNTDDDSHSLIDNIFSSVTGSYNVSGNTCYPISDHLPQFCIF